MTPQDNSLGLQNLHSQPAHGLGATVPAAAHAQRKESSFCHCCSVAVTAGLEVTASEKVGWSCWGQGG